MNDQELNQRLFELASEIAMWKNPQCWFNLEVPEVERLTAIADLEEEMRELIG